MVQKVYSEIKEDVSNLVIARMDQMITNPQLQALIIYKGKK